MSKIEEHRLYVLHRYFIWANLLHEHLDNFDNQLDENDEEIQRNVSSQRFEIEFYLYMSLWFSLLYVVVEGWEQLKLQDKNVDKLLDSDNKDLLRRYRNATFHYQEDNYDPRVTRVMGDPDVIHWAGQLHTAFGIYFKDIFGNYTDNTLFPKHLSQSTIDMSFDQGMQFMEYMLKDFKNKTNFICPKCKKTSTIRMGTMSPKSFTSPCCEVLLRPTKDVCCVFCSYGDTKCFKVQVDARMADIKREKE